MTEADHVLALDLGTTSIKCALYSHTGAVRGEVSREYALETTAGGVVEMSVEAYWQAFSEACRQLLASSDIAPDRIAACGISAQGETLVPVDAAGKPLRNAISWLDSRATDEAAALREEFSDAEIYERTGQPKMLATWPAAKVLWVAQHEPDVLRHLNKWLLLEDYFIARLTGEYVCEYSLATSTCYWDFRSKQWWPEMLTRLGLGEENLPTLCEPGTPVAALRPKVADELGLDPTVLVCAGALDQACGAIGGGGVRPGEVTETTGAAVAICAITDGPRLDANRQIPCHYHGIRDTYMLHTFNSGGIVLKWFRDQIAAAGIDSRPAAAAADYAAIDHAVRPVRAGADGLIVIPYFQGAMAPDSNDSARGAIVGLTLDHGKQHIGRALMESVCFVVRRTLEAMADAGAPARSLRALGGGSTSLVWKQIEADVTQLPVLVMEEPEAATLGAAILAGVGLGWHESAAAAASEMVKIKHLVEPNSDNAEVYDEVYATWRQTYQGLEPSFQRIAAAPALGDTSATTVDLEGASARDG